jgi:hypothetical protein
LNVSGELYRECETGTLLIVPGMTIFSPGMGSVKTIRDQERWQGEQGVGLDDGYLALYEDADEES